MKLINKIKPEIILRLGLGLMFIYSGLNLFSKPSDWAGFVPTWFLDFWNNIAPIEVFLKIQGIGELVIGILLLAWFSKKRGVQIASLLASLEVLSILILVGIDLITFRDLGVLAAALSLTVITFQKENLGEEIPPQTI